MKGFYSRLVGFMLLFCISLMFSATITASDSPRDFKVSTELTYSLSDQGVPVQQTLVTNYVTFEFRNVKAEHLHPWINGDAAQAQSMFIERLNIDYDFTEPVTRIKQIKYYSNLYHAPPLNTIDRYSDLNRISG
jgi:hypothetical protein